MNGSPRYSFVIPARNDNFGGNFLHRFSMCIRTLLELSIKHDLSMELIIVEWNPPDNAPRLIDVLSLPDELKKKPIRIITVPSDVHEKTSHSNDIPYCEFLAKNVGIRRARGAYIAAMNSDIIVSDGLISYLKNIEIPDNAFFRIERYDFYDLVPDELTPIEREFFCKDHSFRVQSLRGQVILDNKEWKKAQLRHRREFFSLAMIQEKIMRELHRIGVGKEMTVEDEHGRSFDGLFINCGDFFLMPSTQWTRLRGYPKIGADRSVDCYMVILADYARLLQVLIPHPIYHQEHSREAQKYRPTAHLQEVPAFKKMIQTSQVVLPNTEQWGLADFVLHEDILMHSTDSNTTQSSVSAPGEAV